MTATTLSDGSTNVLRVEKGDQTRIDVSIDAKDNVTLRSTQALPEPRGAVRHVALPDAYLRWDQEHGTSQAVLQENVGSSIAPRWAPAIMNAGLPGESNALNLALDGAGSLDLASATSKVGRLLSREPADGVRSERDGREVTLKNGYAQDGKILYNGINVVEQSTRGTSQTVLYDKRDLIERARDPEAIQRTLAGDASSRITVSRDGVEALPIDRGVEREHHRGFERFR